MQIDSQPLQVNARRLNVPRVLYGVGGTAVSFSLISMRVIPGQLYKRKVPEYLTAKVVEFAKIKPQDRFRKISQSVSFSPFVFISAAQINVILGRSVPPFRIRRGIWLAD
jgi:hypothetical protein